MKKIALIAALTLATSCTTQRRINEGHHYLKNDNVKHQIKRERAVKVINTVTIAGLVWFVLFY